MRISKLYIPSVFALLMPLAAIGSVADRCAAAADIFLESLDAAQRESAARPFDESERKAWAYVTGSKSRKQGLALGDMSDAQRVLAHRLIACGLSSRGYRKATGIVRRDDIVREYFKDVFADPSALEIGKKYYWLAVFGAPSSNSPWAWQFEGHHLGLNFTAVNGDIAVTPAFLGADPAEVQTGPLAGWRLLGREEDTALELVASLSDAQRARAVLADEVPRGLFTAPGRADSLDAYAGLPAAQMSGAQRQLLWLLIDEYVENYDPVVATRIVGEILSRGVDRVHFAWMGPIAAGSAFYYRIHGPAILIEFDHASNIRTRTLEPDPNHIHTIMRVPGADFGDDLLRRHYAESPDHQGLVIE